MKLVFVSIIESLRQSGYRTDTLKFVFNRLFTDDTKIKIEADFSKALCYKVVCKFMKKTFTFSILYFQKIIFI